MPSSTCVEVMQAGCTSHGVLCKAIFVPPSSVGLACLATSTRAVLCRCLSGLCVAGYTSRGALFKASSEALPAMAAEGQLWSSGVVSGDLQRGLAWLSILLDSMSGHLDKDCFRQAWGAAAAAINRYG